MQKQKLASLWILMPVLSFLFFSFFLNQFTMLRIICKLYLTTLSWTDFYNRIRNIFSLIMAILYKNIHKYMHLYLYSLYFPAIIKSSKQHDWISKNLKTEVYCIEYIIFSLAMLLQGASQSNYKCLKNDYKNSVPTNVTIFFVHTILFMWIRFMWKN